MAEFSTIPELAEFAANRFGEKLALQARRANRFFQVTFDELRTQVSEAASGLLATGLKPGGRVGILSENRPEWAVAYLAIVRAGCAAVPLCPQLKSHELRHIVSVSKCDYLFASSSFLEQAFEITDGVSFFKGVISLDGDSDLTLEDIFIRGRDARSSLPTPKPDDLAALIFTSGTTGMAKGVMLSHKNIISNLVSVYEALNYDSSDNLISVLPLYHTFEATCGMLAPLARGASVTYARSMRPPEIMRDIEDTKATIMLCVPLLYEMILSGIRRRVKKASRLDRTFFKTAWGISGGLEFLRLRPGNVLFKSFRKKSGLESIRLMICGGAPLSPEIARGFMRLGFTFIEGYGLTEASPVLAVGRQGKEKVGSVGQALPGVELKIDKPDENGIGEIVARGDNIMLGYYENPEETAKVIREGWLHTGDLGRLDKDGYLYVTGRIKNLIVTKAGKNIYPEEIEDELMKCRFIKEVVVVGRTDPETKRERVHAIVFPDYAEIDAEAETKGKPYSNQEMEMLIGDEVKKCSEGLPDYKKIKGFEVREDEFPKTATGKIRRFLFQEKTLKL
jgi:long-chain acyl-CoA synthetase